MGKQKPRAVHHSKRRKKKNRDSKTKQGNAADKPAKTSKRSKADRVPLVHPTGDIYEHPVALNEYTAPAKASGFGCNWCKFYQFSYRNPDDLENWRGKTLDNIDHECNSHGVRPRKRTKGKPVEVMFVGEAPGETEDEKGKAFVGRAGELLEATLKASGLINVPHFITNVVRCWPWKMGSGKQKTPTISEARPCLGFLGAEIQHYKPKYIVALGALAYNALCENPSISLSASVGQPRRKVVAGHECWVIPQFHPAYIARNDYLLPDYFESFTKLKKFIEKGGKRKTAKPVKYKVLYTPDEVAPVMARMIKEGKPVAYDIEADVSYKRSNGKLTLSPARKNASVALFGFSNNPNKVYVVVLDHRKIREGKKDRGPHYKKLLKMICNFLSTDDMIFVAQNKKFDNALLKSVCPKFGRMIHREIHDTMLMSYVLDESRGKHNLESLAERLAGMTGFKEEITRYEEDLDYDFTQIPLKHSTKYNAHDVAATLRVYRKLRKKVEKSEDFEDLALHFLPRVQETFADLEVEGVAIDLDAAEVIKEKFELRAKRCLDQAMSIPEVEKFIRYAEKRAKKEKKKFTFSLNSSHQLRKIFFDKRFFGYEPLHKTDNNESSTDRKTLIHLRVEEQCPLATLVQDFRLYRKLIGTYVEPIVHDVGFSHDGRLHGSFHLINTVTGRAASSDPNLQNIPNRGDGDVKRLFVSRYGVIDDEAVSLLLDVLAGRQKWSVVKPRLRRYGVLLAYDYSQMEVRVWAVLSGDKNLMRAYLNNEDLHLKTTCALFNTTPEKYAKLKKNDPKKASMMRTIAKRVMFGTIYGSGPSGICNTLSSEDPPIYISENEAQRFIDRLFRLYKGGKRWIDRVIHDLDENGYVTSPVGRRRRLNEAFSENEALKNRAHRQGPNAIIQSFASDTTLTSLTILNEMLRDAESTFLSRPILTVHDSIVFDCTLDEVIDVARMAQRVMEKIYDYAHYVWKRKGIFDVLKKIPLKAEGEVGLNYRDMIEFSSFGKKFPDGDKLSSPEPISDLPILAAIVRAYYVQKRADERDKYDVMTGSLAL